MKTTHITVTPNLFISDSGIYQTILNYYKDGKRQQKWKSLKIKATPGTKRIAKQKAAEVARKFEEELNTDAQKDAIDATGKADILYGDYLQNEWLPSIKSSLEVTTYASYQHKVKIIAEYFNNLKIKLGDLNKHDIKSFYKHLKKTRNIKNQTIKRYHANIHKSLVDAIELDLIETNPADNIKLDKAQQYISCYYKQAELEDLFEVAKGSFIELHILLASYYGLRREEVCRFEVV